MTTYVSATGPGAQPQILKGTGQKKVRIDIDIVVYALLLLYVAQLQASDDDDIHII